MDDINDTSSNNVDSNNFITSYDDYYAFVDSLINNVENNNITTNVPLADSDFAPVVDNNKELDEYLNSFPPGYKFKPHDEELIVYYLKKKILNEPLPPNRIYEVELYKFNPETLAANYASSGDGQREKEWYFFTSRDRKYPNGIRPRRDAGDGHWKATGADKIIKFNGVVVGLKKTLVFHKGKAGDGGDKTEWLMHEYRVNDPPKRKRNDDDMKLDDWVLCRIYTKTKSLTQPQEQAIQVEEPLEIGNVNLLAEQMVGADYLDYSGFAASPSSSNFPFHYSQLPIDQEYVHHLPN